jgi:hypothetical protein
MMANRPESSHGSDETATESNKDKSEKEYSSDEALINLKRKKFLRVNFSFLFSFCLVMNFHLYVIFKRPELSDHINL